MAGTRDMSEAVAAVIGAHPFPYGNASANRMLMLAEVFAAAGFHPFVLNDDPRLEAANVNEQGMAGEVPFVNLGCPGATRRRRLRRRRSLPVRLTETLLATVPREAVEIVLVPSIFYTPALARRLRGTFPHALTIVDVVERHDPQQFRARWLTPYFVRHRFTSWFARFRADLIIVISSALASGPFRGRRPFVLPPTVDLSAFSYASEQERPSQPVTITYFGSPGSKDDLSSVVDGICRLTPQQRQRLRVVVAGVNQDGLARLPGVGSARLVEVSDVVEAVGRLTRREVIELLAQTHYTFLVRDPEAGFARYGFPSKVPESLAAGCPPITNLTSDLDRYLSDGTNAIICAGSDSESVAQAIQRAMASVFDGEHLAQSRAATQLARTAFAHEAWGQPLREWLTVQVSGSSGL